MRTLNSREVTYTRGAASVTLQATCYEVSQEELLNQGISVDVRKRDYIFSASGLVFEGGSSDSGGTQQITPEAGDIITDRELICKVLPMGSLPCWKWTSHLRNSLRVHTEVIE